MGVSRILTDLRSAILIDPDDDLAYLAYADACEESGDVRRATWIRESPSRKFKCDEIVALHPWLIGVNRGEGRYRVYHGPKSGVTRLVGVDATVIFKRGFTRVIHAQWDAAEQPDFIRCVRENPIDYVGITGAIPREHQVASSYPSRVYWCCSRFLWPRGEWIPEWAFSYLIQGEPAGVAWYPRMSDACKALSDAIIAYCREEKHDP